MNNRFNVFKHVKHVAKTPHPIPCGRHKCMVPNHFLIGLPMHETKIPSLRCFFHHPRNQVTAAIAVFEIFKENKDLHTIYFKRVLPIKLLTFAQKKD